jgi:hypothetical protein
MRPARYVLPETIGIATVALADLLTTTYLIGTGRAWEGNPLMAEALRRFGPTGFIGLKAALIAVPLAVAETARSRHPQFVQRMLRLGLIVYLAMWLWGMALVTFAS